MNSPFKVSKLYGIWHTAIVIIHIKYYLILIILNAIRSEINGDSEGGDIIFRLGDYDCLMMNIMGVRLGASHFLKVRHITIIHKLLHFIRLITQTPDLPPATYPISVFPISVSGSSILVIAQASNLKVIFHSLLYAHPAH